MTLTQPTPLVWVAAAAVGWFVFAAAFGSLVGRYLAWRNRDTRHGIPHPWQNWLVRRRNRRALRALDARHRERMQQVNAAHRRYELAGHDVRDLRPVPEHPVTLPTHLLVERP